MVHFRAILRGNLGCTVESISTFFTGQQSSWDISGGEIPSYAGLLGSGPTLKERRKGTMMRQDLQAIQKEARGLLRALQRNDFATTRRYRHSDVVESNFHARLADAQYIVARRYGFKSWVNLKDSLSSRRTEIPAKFTTTAR